VAGTLLRISVAFLRRLGGALGRSALLGFGSRRIALGLLPVPVFIFLLTFSTAGLSAAPAVAGGEKTFMFINVHRDLNEFREFARVVSRLKRYGRVQVNISTVADKSWYMLPEGGSPWHEYTAYNPTLFKFFPHPKIARHIPAADVRRNRRLLLAKSRILRKLGLDALFWCYMPNYLPESFFEEFPHLRGPRVDHPRRSRKEAFAMCVDLDESLAMYRWMARELKRNVPELKTIVFKTNDAGSGLCWAAAQYSGPNGPAHCRNRNVGERVRGLVEALHRGAEEGGGKIDVRIGGSNFWQGEDEIVVHYLPPDTYLDSRDPTTISLGGMVNQTYPATGILNPLAILRAMERYDRPGVKNVMISCRVSYERANEPVKSVEKIVEIMENWINKPVHGLLPRLNRLYDLSVKWGGEENAERVFNSFYKLDEALKLKRASAPNFRVLYNGVSMRHITRPLVIKPDLLSADEKSYFLPYIFNIHESEALNDYIDSHGSRMGPPSASWSSVTSLRISGLQRALGTALSAARGLESITGGPERQWLNGMGLSLRMWVSFVRSINNFYFGQIIRDRNRKALAGPPRIPPKVATWFGDRDILEWNRIMRDEFDNTNELIELLNRGGLKLFCRAKSHCKSVAA